MKVGFNMLLWTPDVQESHFPIFEKLKDTGYDGVELPIYNVDLDQYQSIGKALKEFGLKSTAVTIIHDEEHSPISPNAQHRRSGVEYLKQILDCCQAAGAETLSGPIYQPLGKFSGNPPTEEEKKGAAEVHAEVADYAARAGITLGVEALNRFECYFMNTARQAAEHARRVGKNNFGILFDTFHANIEEKNPAAALAENIDMVKHVHISSNTRGTPGHDHVPWDGIFNVLRQNHYDDWLTIEAFGHSIPELAATTCVWRNLSANNEEVYQVGYKTIREKWNSAP